MQLLGAALLPAATLPDNQGRRRIPRRSGQGRTKTLNRKCMARDCLVKTFAVGDRSTPTLIDDNHIAETEDGIVLQHPWDLP